MELSLENIAAATGGRVVGPAEQTVSGIGTDSRTVAAGQLFVALRGEHFDGHAFIATAGQRQAAAALVAEEWLARQAEAPLLPLVVVGDTLQALGDLAAAWRRHFQLPLVAVTGSNGKTTTKEMLAAILSLTGPGLKTEGNLNNLIGLPLTLSRLSASHRWAVLEMGMSEFGEIQRLAAIAAPRIGIITNAFPAHLATLGSVEGVARAKGELFLALPADGWGVANADDPLISRLPLAPGVQCLTFGLESGMVTARDIRTTSIGCQAFTLRLPDGEAQVELAVPGRHNVMNALAAACGAHLLGLSAVQIARGLATFRSYSGRSQVLEIGGCHFIDDSYNANPASMQSGLQMLRDLSGGSRAIAVLGDMLELGESEADAHRQLGRQAAACAGRLFVLGSQAETVAAAARAAGLDEQAVTVATSHGEIVAALRVELQPGDWVLVKGSRGMRMENVLAGYRELQGREESR